MYDSVGEKGWDAVRRIAWEQLAKKENGRVFFKTFLEVFYEPRVRLRTVSYGFQRRHHSVRRPLLMMLSGPPGASALTCLSITCLSI